MNFHSKGFDSKINTVLSLEESVSSYATMWYFYIYCVVKSIHPKFVSIGADSKGHGLPEPSAEKTTTLIRELRKFTEVRLKPNLARIIGKKAMLKL